MNPPKRVLAVTLCVLFLASLAPVVAQHPDTVTVDITVHWHGVDHDLNAHAYLLTFSDNGTYAFETHLEHVRNGTSLPSSSSTEWGSKDDHRTALVTFDTDLEWGDQITLTVNITSHDGETVNAQQVRSFVVGVWNQPMDDHEVMVSSTWSLEQEYSDGLGEQRFSLVFNGQGWQERVGSVLSSWELGNGTFQTLETTQEGQTDLDLVLTHVWKNETVVGGILTHQVFDARGFGDLETVIIDGATETVIHADVSQAELNRSFAEGLVGERLLLEATGTLNVSEEGVDNDSLTIDGDLAVFFFEYHDIDGVRVLQHTQFEAMADFVLIDDGSRLDVSLDGFSSLERWENGVRTEHLEELYGGGTFGFADAEDNASVQVNGTILDLHTKIENGTTVIDDLHVDGVLTGDVQGSFGVVRAIETTGMQTNATGQAFLVNVIFQESWFNITGINGGNFFDGAGVGATHNETWDYQVVNSDWDNRTVRLVWRETGPDASEGEEFPERSPIERNATPPESEEGLGDLTVGRETGLMPIPMRTGDRFRLSSQEGIELTVTAGSSALDNRDGKNLTVVQWTGFYGQQGESGNASGAIVSSGPLSGLISNVQRQLAVPFGEDNETVALQETQLLQRVLSPDIVSEEQNTPPSISQLGLREGLVVGEGGGQAHFQVTVEDTEWNVVQVTADLSGVGLGTLELNDRGLNGDQAVGDDVYTSAFGVTGLETGSIPVSVVAVDRFGATSTLNGSIAVVNQGPRLLKVDFAPDSLERGQSMVINVKAYDGHGVAQVQLDLREYGGSMVNLSLNDGLWTGMVEMPVGMSPGDRSLIVVATDAQGAVEQYRTAPSPEGSVGDAVFGPHFVIVVDLQPIKVEILNDRPALEAIPLTVEKQVDTPVVYTVNASDPDGIERVQINLGVYAPVGVAGWVTMHDDGINGGDDKAGDGVYSVTLSIRDGTPLGTHEVFLRSMDLYGEENTSSTVINLVEPELSSGGDGVDNVVFLALGGGVLLAAGIVLVLMWRRQEGNGGQQDRFGFE